MSLPDDISRLPFEMISFIANIFPVSSGVGRRIEREEREYDKMDLKYLAARSYAVRRTGGVPSREEAIELYDDYRNITDIRSIVNDLIKFGYLTRLKHVFTQYPEIRLIPEYCSIAARYGHLQVLKFLRSKDCPWNAPRVAIVAAGEGHINIIEWIKLQNIPDVWTKILCDEAAANGRINVLIWLRSQTPPCPWDEWTCTYAAQGGQLEVLQWLRAQNPPCPWDELTCAHAAHRGHLKVLKWLMKNGCKFNFDQRLIANIRVKGHEKVIRFIENYLTTGRLD